MREKDDRETEIYMRERGRGRKREEKDEREMTEMS
jgi:hypothetical protein